MKDRFCMKQIYISHQLANTKKTWKNLKTKKHNSMKIQFDIKLS